MMENDQPWWTNHHHDIAIWTASLSQYWLHIGILLCVPLSPFMKKLYKKFTKKAQEKLKKKSKRQGKMVIKYRSKNGTLKVTGTKKITLNTSNVAIITWHHLTVVADWVSVSCSSNWNICMNKEMRTMPEGIARVPCKIWEAGSEASCSMGRILVHDYVQVDDITCAW